MKKEFTVDKRFILEAHEAACSEWKRKLEEKFPEAFKKNNVIEFIESKIGKCGYDVEMFVYDCYLVIKLPNANANWTFRVWDYVKKICNIEISSKFPLYPVHGPRYEARIKKAPEWREGENYQIVDISGILRII